MADENIKEVPRRITKIKAKKGIYCFGWEVYRDQTNSWDQYTFSCKDMPRPELLERLQVMANHVTTICEFAEQETKKLIVSGVSLSYNEKGNCYLVITAQKALLYSKAPLVINTPARPAEPENESDSYDYCWSDELADDIEILQKEAWKYISGERAQQTLDFEGGEKPKEEAITEITKGEVEGGLLDPVTVNEANIGA